MKKTAIFALAVLICGALTSCEADSIPQSGSTSEMATGGGDGNLPIPPPPPPKN